ncbi:MAG TPA: TetR/AcrR family transcriptional regulator [Acidimicrobiales bacterium]|nr:TetR/AcrR family transcriptional regulator [Acidimicrobiales bacterium]
MKSEDRSRRYDNRLRREQQRSTRERIVAAAADLLGEGEQPTMGAVAERAGVAERTVYRHFGTRSDLSSAVFESVTDDLPRVALPTSADELADMVKDVFPRYELRPEVIRALGTSEIGAENREGRAEARRRQVSDALAGDLAGLSDAERRRTTAAVHVLASSGAYLHLHDFWDMDAAEAADVVGWAVRALVRAAAADGETK